MINGLKKQGGLTLPCLCCKLWQAGLYIIPFSVFKAGTGGGPDYTLRITNYINNHEP